jgi:hypothetical protein
MGKKTASAEATATISTVQVSLEFKYNNEKKFEPTLSKILQCSIANPYKEAPKEILDTCKLARDEYVTARTNRDANPSPANTQFMEAANVRAGNAFEVLAKWVQDNCDNDVAIALSFGFKVVKTARHAATLLDTPTDVKWSYDMPGTIVFKCKSFGRGVRYIVECSTDNGLTWTVCGISSKSYRIVASGLVRGKEYMFRLYGLNDAGNGKPWTSAGILAAV